MSSDAYRFTVVGDQVTEIFEIEHGVPHRETIDVNETYKLIDATTVLKTETKHAYLEIETFIDADGDGLYLKAGKTYELLGSAVDTVGEGVDDEHAEDGDDGDIDDDGSDDDVYHGLLEDELVYGSIGRDRIFGDDGDDDLDGGVDDDELHGDSGSDDLYGRAGDDDLFGGEGDDFLYGGEGDDVYDGGKGFDVADFSAATKGVLIRLSSKAARDTGEGSDKFKSIEGLKGGDFDDYLEGSRADNSLLGGDGHDILSGKGGNDSLIGGLGEDIFVIDYKVKSGAVLELEDFTSGEDKLQLAEEFFKGVSAANLDETFVNGAAALESDDRLIFDDATGTLYYDRDGSGHKDAVAVAIIGPGALAVDDLLLV